MDYLTAISLFEAPEDDVQAAQRVNELARTISSSLWNGVEPDYVKNTADSQFYLFGAETLDIEDDDLVDLCVIVTLTDPKFNGKMTGLYGVFKDKDGNATTVLNKYTRLIRLDAMHGFHESELKRVAGTVEFVNLLKHELVHLNDARLQRLHGAGTSTSGSQYYNNPAEFNAYYHSLVETLTELATVPVDQFKDYAELYDFTGKFSIDIRSILGDPKSRVFLSWLSSDRRKALMRRVYKMYQHVKERADAVMHKGEPPTE